MGKGESAWQILRGETQGHDPGSVHRSQHCRALFQRAQPNLLGVRGGKGAVRGGWVEEQPAPLHVVEPLPLEVIRPRLAARSGRCGVVIGRNVLL